MVKYGEAGSRGSRYGGDMTEDYEINRGKICEANGKK